MFASLRLMLTSVIKSGRLVVEDSDGGRTSFGDGEGPPIKITIRGRKLERRLAFDPELAAGEGYMAGTLTIEEGSAYDFIALMMRNLARTDFPPWARSLARLRMLNRRLRQRNHRTSAQSNVRRHYDIDPRIYDLFLDSDMQYSCAYFEPGANLEEAQLAKKRHIAAKLALSPGQSVLDIGSGWGGLALYLAGAAGADVTGITLSDEQLKVSARRAAEQGRGSSVRFLAKDYRDVEGTFDRIVSVGMFEHVGVPQYGAYFQAIRRLLKDDGVALVHTIGRSDPPGTTNPFILKYIFPGGYIPALSEVVAAIEPQGLLVTDIEVLRLHYALTLRAWRERFLARIEDARRIAGEEFCRMWEWYLAGAEGCFRYQNFVVYQIQLTKRVDTLPILRNYMAGSEEELRNGSLAPTSLRASGRA